MRDLFCFSAIAVFLLSMSGCTSYYYSMLGSNDLIGEKSKEGDFVQENDTVCITYCFWGERAPVMITIYNKLDEPLYVDWGRSALVIEDVAISYDSRVATMQGASQGVSSTDTYQWNRQSGSSRSYSEGQFAGDIMLPKGVEFIPPGAKIVSTRLQLDNLSFAEIPDGAFEKRNMTTNKSTPIHVKIKKFTEEDSPLRFRSYLTLYTGGENGKEVRHSSFGRSFYVAQLIKAGNVAPGSFDEGLQKAGDFFYIREVRGVKAGLVIGAIAVTAAGVAVEATLGPVNN